jgi:hypothetical protein
VRLLGEGEAQVSIGNTLEGWVGGRWGVGVGVGVSCLHRFIAG